MNILSLNYFNLPKYTNNTSADKNICIKKYGLKMQAPLVADTVSFKAAKFKDTMRIPLSHQLEKKANIYLDILESIANKLNDKGVSINRAYCELNIIKSDDSCCKKIARSSSTDIRDRLRATIFVRNITDMNLLNDILKEFELRGLVLFEERLPIEKMIAKGYVPKKNDKDFILVPDLDIRLAEGQEGIVNLPENLRFCYGKPQKSGYEDIQLRLIDKYEKNPVKHELIILTGEQYAIAKHREYENVYKITRKLDALNVTKYEDENNEFLKLIKRYITLIKQLCTTEISQKLFENAKNKDVYNINNIIEIKITEKDIQTLKNYFIEMRKNIELYYTNAKKEYPNERKLQYALNKELKQSLEETHLIEQELIKSVRQVNKGKYPKTLDELVKQIKAEKTTK